MAEEPDRERRIDVRSPIELKVEYKRLNTFFADYTKNISRGGTFIKTSRPLPVGTEFLFKLVVPGREVPLTIHGEVQRIIGIRSPARDMHIGPGKYDSEDSDQGDEGHHSQNLRLSLRQS